MSGGPVIGHLSDRVVGTVVRLQVQRSRLKPGPRGARAYDPSPLAQVDALEVGPDRLVGRVGDQRLLDVHSADHPDSRHRGAASVLSLLTVDALARLRQAYGDHVEPGESVLVDGDLGGGDLVVETDEGLLALADLAPAAPCLEFTRFCLGREPGALDDEVAATLEALGGGARGTYARPLGTGTVRVGARLLRA